MDTELVLLDDQTAVDLQSYLARAKRLDPSGLVRLRAYGDILTAYVAPIYSGSLMDSGPTVLGLRTARLKQAAEVDVLVPIQSVLDRLARILEGTPQGLFRSEPKRDLRLELPPGQRAPWAGIAPPRTGWLEVGSLNERVLTEIARNGIAEVANSLPESVGGPIAARIRGEIWGRSIDLTSKVPTGAAFVAAGLGFLTENEEIGLYHAQGWIRLSSTHGHVLAREATKF